MYAVYQIIGEYISGCTASGLFEARLGITIEKLEEELGENPRFLEGVDGFHFHTLCEQNSDDLETTLEAVEQKFGKYLYDMKWLNMGGGHHITRKDYDVERLVRLVNHMKEKYQVQVYLEPGEAIIPFDRKIQIGDTLYFEDMAIYSMVKNNTFNGIGLPDIVLRHENGECEVVKHFGYEDFKGRLS